LISQGTLQGPITPPIGLAYLAASLLEAGHVVTIVDALGEAPRQVTPLFEHKMLATGLLIPEILQRVPARTDLIGVSAMFSGEWPYIRQLIEALKQARPATPLVGGGEHFTAMPEFTLESCPQVDYCVLGEGEETLVDLANQVERGEAPLAVAGLALRQQGKVTRTAPRQRIKSVDALPRPAWSLVPLENYLSQGLGYGVDRGRSMPIVATRGCPYQCTFCSNPFMWTTRWFARQPAEVLAEIEYYLDHYQATNIDFYDLTAIIKKDWIVEFCQLILERGLKFTWQLPSGTRSEAIDWEVSRLLYQSGCRNLTYAPESGSPTTLKRIKKKVKLERMLLSMRDAVRNGLNLKANIIIGFPDETRREVWQTLLFLLKMAWVGAHDISISMFSPYPGSELFADLQQRGRLTDLSDAYFLSLASYTDVTETVSWCEAMSKTEMAFLRLFGLALFYGAEYLFRPWRLLQTLTNLIFNRQESRLDKSLQDYLARSFKRHAAEAN
jgi:radical SAM superfamily enzyme YgiQ (UPF0313 family)